MSPCQKQRFEQKMKSYELKIKECEKAIAEQKKRIMCFQGLIAQLKATISDSEKEDAD